MKSTFTIATSCRKLYIYGEHATDGQWCNNVLKFESLSHDFDVLMKAKGYTVSLDGVVQNPSDDCNVDSRDLVFETKELIHNVYLEDFNKLGYSYRKN